ncbi:alpha/beta hydrolase [Alkalicoccus halolimnae]|uniref:Alpha/beta hydrolase n=1 Tax=Alkalicoccus halolimnae TaxID=1667239 RepID=A0A5C7FH59_9BACI|nr:alpha/beta hydrolase [Alkalicoccus halolimnae]TXF83043.1 hypothetical protein FTX54_13660 [Alkalicoccus halolimnae]
MKVFIGACLTAAIAVYFLFAWNVISSQEESLFQGASLSEERINQVNEHFHNTEEINFETEDGNILHGWLQHSDKNSPSPLVIYFGGNAEEASTALESNQYPDDWSVLFMNYRGYGKSTGTPGEDNLYKDGTALFDYVSSREDINSHKIVAAGRSMGTSAASYVSKQRPVAATILISPYDSRTRLQGERHPLFPVERFIRHPFEVSEMAETISSPLLGITADEDQVIPAEHSHKTFSRWDGKTRIVTISGEGHNTLQGDPVYWQEITQFLNDL